MPFKSETIADGAVLVSLRCRACVYEWDIEIAEGMVVIARKRDRRRTANSRRGVKILPA